MSTAPALKSDIESNGGFDSAVKHTRNEDLNLHEMFELLGWGMLPLELKYAIREDVKGVVDELQGRYSSCDRFVRRRRKRVLYWVECYMEGICRAHTAVEALSYQN